MALTGSRNTPEQQSPIGQRYSYPVATGAVIYQGAAIGLNAQGYADDAASVPTGFIAVGVAQKTINNTGLAAGAQQVPFRQGVHLLKNSSAGDLITIAEIGDDCFFVDDEQVAKTSNGGTRARAGKVKQVDAAGVWVVLGLGY